MEGETGGMRFDRRERKHRSGKAMNAFLRSMLPIIQLHHSTQHDKQQKNNKKGGKKELPRSRDTEETIDELKEKCAEVGTLNTLCVHL